MDNKVKGICPCCHGNGYVRNEDGDAIDCITCDSYGEVTVNPNSFLAMAIKFNKEEEAGASSFFCFYFSPGCLPGCVPGTRKVLLVPARR